LIGVERVQLGYAARIRSPWRGYAWVNAKVLHIDR
jgi:hypothetical protein